MNARFWDWIGLLIVCIVSGCAQLTVNVDAYRGIIPPARVAVVSMLGAWLKMVDPQTLRQERESSIGLVKQAAYQQYAAAGLPQDEADKAWAGLELAVASAWAPVQVSADAARQRAQRLQDDFRNDLQTPVGDPKARAFASIEGEVGVFLAKRNEFASQLRATVLGFANISPEDRRSTLNDLERVVPDLLGRGIASSEEAQGRMVGTPLFDPTVSRLSKLDSDWATFGENRFYASGGTSQFVVVREGLVVYRQKSLDFDPTPAVGAGTAVTKVGLKVAAALASGAIGVPNIGVAATSTDRSAATPEAQTDVELDVQVRKQRAAAVEAAKFNLLMSLASLLDEVDKGEDPTLLRQELRRQMNYFSGRVAATKGESK